MIDEGWAFYIETPPSFDQTPPTIPQLDVTSPLEATEIKSVLKERSGLVRVTAEGDSPPTLGANEMECRVLIVNGLPEKFDESDLARLVNPPSQVNTWERNANGSVILEFYDLRSANTYRQRFEGATFDGDPLEVKYGSARKRTDNDRPANNGTLVLFRVPPSLVNWELSDIFSKYGEIRQIRCTPTKPGQRFIEFWDTRAAAAALEEMNGKFVAGSKISIEFSVPGGMRRRALE